MTVAQLYFDVGNTCLKWALDVSGKYEWEGRFNYHQKDFSQLVLPEGVEVESVWASSVASKEVCCALEEWSVAELGLPVRWASVNKQQSGIKNKYQALEQLGVDRWMAVLGARQGLVNANLLDNAVIVVDAGTAVTVDVLDSQSCFVGGFILPGLVMMHDALVGRTAGIHSSLSQNEAVLGKNTVECVNSGVHFGYLGALERVISEALSQLSDSGSDVVLYVTGGDAEFIERSMLPVMKKVKVCEVLPSLVLDGLRCVAREAKLK